MTATRMVGLILAAGLALPGAPPSHWAAVEGIAPGTRVRVSETGRGKPEVSGTLVRAGANSIVVNSKTGERAVDRSAVRVIQVAAPQRRMRQGLIGVGVGTGIGLGLGLAVCPYCPNEGSRRFEGIGAALGAGIGALGFLFTPYQTIYKAPKR